MLVDDPLFKSHLAKSIKRYDVHLALPVLDNTQGL